MSKVTMDDIRRIIREETQTASEEARKQATDNMGRLNYGQPSGERPKGPEGKAIGFARLVRAVSWARNDPDKARHFTEKAIKAGPWDDMLGDRIYKFLSSGDFDQGGFLVPADQSSEVVELLRARSVVRPANPRRVSIARHGTLTIPRIASGASSGWVGEAGSRNAADLTGEHIQFSAKKLYSKMALTQEMLDWSDPNADEIVRDELISEAAITEDSAFLRGDGTLFSPKGLTNWAVAGNKFNSNGTTSPVTTAEVRQDIKTAVQNLKNNNVRMVRPWWFWAPRTSTFLQFERTDADGRLIFADEIKNGRFQGFPFGETTTLPINLGGGSDESEIILADMNEVMVADAPEMEIKASDEASFTDSSGNTVSAFDDDLRVIKLTKHVDMQVRHPEAISVIEQVTYGV